MQFSKQTLSILRRNSGEKAPVVVTVLNKLYQEFKIEGYIPKAYSIIDGERVPNSYVQPDYLTLRFGKDQYSFMKLNPVNNNPNSSLVIKEITTPDGVTLFETNEEEYNAQAFEFMKKVYLKYHDFNYYTTSSPYWDIIQSLLGRVVIYTGDEDIFVKGKECVITHIGKSMKEDELYLQLRYGNERSNIAIAIEDIKKVLYVLPLSSKNLNYQT